MTVGDLDALFDATPDAAMILLGEPDWRGAKSARPMHRRGEGAREHVLYRGLPVWVVNPGPSRVLTGEQVRAEALDGL